MKYIHMKIKNINEDFISSYDDEVDQSEEKLDDILSIHGIKFVFSEVGNMLDDILNNFNNLHSNFDKVYNRNEKKLDFYVLLEHYIRKIIHDSSLEFARFQETLVKNINNSDDPIRYIREHTDVIKYDVTGFSTPDGTNIPGGNAYTLFSEEKHGKLFNGSLVGSFKVIDPEFKRFKDFIQLLKIHVNEFPAYKNILDGLKTIYKGDDEYLRLPDNSHSYDESHSSEDILTMTPKTILKFLRLWIYSFIMSRIFNIYDTAISKFDSTQDQIENSIIMDFIERIYTFINPLIEYLTKSIQVY